MRSSLIIASLVFVLSACTLPWSTPSGQKSIEYPTTQSGSPAAEYCMKNGGQVSYEKNPNIPTMDMIYCTPPNGTKMDAWKYMGDTTYKTGAVQSPAL